MLRRLLWIFSFTAAGIGMPAHAQEFADPQAPVTVRREACTGSSVWVEVDGAGECVRYFASNLQAQNPQAVVFLHGDVIWQGTTVAAYKTATSAARQALADQAAIDTGLPVIMIARPGTYGSSGDHTKRRQPRELKIVEAALSDLLKRYQVAEFGLSGQSGGGSVAAYLATRLDNLKCAVFSSPALSIKTLRRVGQDNGYFYGDDTIYDAMQHIQEMVRNGPPYLYIVGDPLDSYALIQNQIEYFEAARAARLNIVRMESEGKGHHTLDRTGWNIAAWCLKGEGQEQIYGKLLSGIVRY